MPNSSAPADRITRGRWLSPALLGLLLGSALQLQQPDLWSTPVYICFMLVALMGYALIAIKNVVNNGHPVVVLLLLLGLTGLLAAGFTGLRALSFVSHRLDPALQGRDVAVIGVVASLPQAFDLGLRFRFAPESAQLGGQALLLPPRLELAWYSGKPASADDADEALAEAQRLPDTPRAGERWQFTVRLKAVHGSVNPHGFDHELHQWEQGVQATGYVRSGRLDPLPQRLAVTGWYPVEQARQQLRERIFQKVSDADAAGLIAALVVGDQGAIERADWQVFRATGVAHLMSISGLHITMFAWAAALAVGWLWRRLGRWCLWLPAANAALVGGVVLASAYALFSGFGVPAQRTVLMLACVALLRLSGLRWPWPQVWLLTCAVVVAIDPWALLQAGFWLSFVAVGVLFASDSVAVSADGQRAGGRFASMFREQWVITLALAPLSLVLFGQVSLLGLPANALAIPWVTLLITPLAMLGTLLPDLWQLAAWAAELMLRVLRWLAALPWAVLTVAKAPWWAAGAAVLGGVLLVLRLPWWLRSGGLPLLLPVLLWQPARPAVGQFELLAADIGQGSAVLIRTARHALLFDAGPRYSQDSDAGQRVLAPLLRALDVRLDRLVLSHKDSDHIGGAAALLALQPQAELLSSFTDDRLTAAARQATLCQAGQHWQWDGVDFDVLHPFAQAGAEVRNSNATSCVLRISNGRQTALLTGDIEQAQEAILVQRVLPQNVDRPGGPSGLAAAGVTSLQADLLVVPHHGSRTSSSDVFLDAVQPRIAVVQAGYRNRFGHPAGPVLVRYADRQVQVIDTPHCGALTWQSWQAELQQCQRQVNRHYWQHRF